MFQIGISYSFKDMLWTRIKLQNKQRAITQKIPSQELKFLCTALPLIEIYLHMKFQNDTSNTFKDMLRTIINLQNKQRAITKKIQNQESWFLCTALPLDVIYSPMKFKVNT